MELPQKACLDSEKIELEQSRCLPNWKVGEVEFHKRYLVLNKE